MLAFPPLHLVSVLGMADLVAPLCEMGAITNAWNREGEAPLHLLAMHTQSYDSKVEATLRALSAHGANPNTLNSAGDTAAQIARLRGLDDLASLPDDPALQTVPSYVRDARALGIRDICLLYDKADGFVFCISYPDEGFLVGGDYNGMFPCRAHAHWVLRAFQQNRL